MTSASEDFPEPTHAGFCGPESLCDMNCVTIKNMVRHNRLINLAKSILSEEMTEPRFVHDCDACVFLGHTQSDFFRNDGKMMDFDLYICMGGEFKTVLARYGNAGSEYASLCVDQAETLHGPLQTAWDLAVEKGFVEER